MGEGMSVEDGGGGRTSVAQATNRRNNLIHSANRSREKS